MKKCLILLIALLALLVSPAALATDYYTSGDFEYYFAKDSDAIVISSYTGSGKDLAIPSELDGHKVVRIGYAAFRDCTTLTRAVIPEGVTEIDEQAFEGCTALTDVVIPEGVTKIEYGTFKNCTALSRVTIPETVSDIESYAFENCTSLRGLYFPPHVGSISEYAFTRCYRLRPSFQPGSSAERYFRDFWRLQIAWFFPLLPLFCGLMGILAVFLVFRSQKDYLRYLSPGHRYRKIICAAALLLGLFPVVFMFFLLPKGVSIDRFYSTMGFGIIGCMCYPAVIILGLVNIFRPTKKPAKPKKEIEEEDLRAFLGAAADVMEEAKGYYTAQLQHIQDVLQNEKNVKLKSALKAAGQILGKAVINTAVSHTTGTDPVYLDNELPNLGDTRLIARASLEEIVRTAGLSIEKLRSSDPGTRSFAEKALMMYCLDNRTEAPDDREALRRGHDIFTFMANYLDTLPLRSKARALQYFANSGLFYGKALTGAAESFMEKYT